MTSADLTSSRKARGGRATSTKVSPQGEARLTAHEFTQDLTARLLIEIPKRFPNVRLWRQNTGGGIGMSTVKQAIGLVRSGQYALAIKLLSSRPMKWGVEGGGDLSGIVTRRYWESEKPGVPAKDDILFEASVGIRLEIEIKGPGDAQSDSQHGFGAMIADRGGIYIVATSVDQCLAELGRLA